MIRATGRALAHAHETKDAEGSIDHSPAINDATKQIAGEQRLRRALRLNEWQENFIAVVFTKPLGGELLDAGEGTARRPTLPAWRG